MSEPAVTRYAFPTRDAAPAPNGVPAWAAPPRSEVRTIALGRAAAPAAAIALPPPVVEVAPSIAQSDPPPVVAAPTPTAPPRAATVPPEVERPSERALVEAARALERARPEILATIEGELLELAVDIATVLVEDELSRRPELHRALVRAALDGIDPGPGVRVRASRATYEALLEAFDRAAVDAGRGRVNVELDASLDGHGAVVDVEGASIDGRIGPRLAALRTAFEQALRTRKAA